MKYCAYCGAKLAEESGSFCTECGRELPQTERESGRQGREKGLGGKTLKTQEQGDHPDKGAVAQGTEEHENAEKIIMVDQDEGYDGYYDDVLPEDYGSRQREEMDRELVKKVAMVICAVLMIVSVCVLMMYLI